jgi:hypothetical protein
MKKIWKYSRFLWAGGEKFKRFFRRLGFCAAPRGLKNRRRKDDRKRAGEGRPLGRIVGGGFSTSAGVLDIVLKTKAVKKYCPNFAEDIWSLRFYSFCPLRKPCGFAKASFYLDRFVTRQATVYINLLTVI